MRRYLDGAFFMLVKSIIGTPAVKALLLQTLACAITFLLIIGMMAFAVSPSVLFAALIQGVLAAILSAYFRQERWWLVIQFLFPITLVLVLGLKLPPSIFLLAFLFLLVLFWSTFRTQVPFYPSGSAVQHAIAGLLPHHGSIQMIDVGSGLGGLILNLANRFARHRFIGIEIAPLPWLVSWLRARLSGSRAKFVRANYEKLNFADYDIIFAYLSPAAMPALWHKARQEMRKESLLLSYEFAISGVTPAFEIVCGASDTPLYGFRM